MHPLTSSLAEHLEIYFSGLLTLSVVAHAVQTFPTPKNKYGQWAIGVVQYVVGQRLSAQNTLKGLDTIRGSSPIELRGTGASIEVPVPPASKDGGKT